MGRRRSMTSGVGAVVALLAFGMGPAAPGAQAAGTAMPDDGPHSPLGRVPAVTTVEHGAGVVVRDVDLGDVNIGPKGRPQAFRSPVRGLLVTPDRPKANAPLVVVSHLRTFGCADRTFAYPCAKGVQEMRADRGMTYLGQALAAKGYAVLVPDLGPLWTAGLIEEPYDQRAAWLSVVSRLRDEAMAADAGRPTRFGAGLEGAIDGSRTALVMHSRSAVVADTAVRGWAGSSTPIASLASYGGFYALPEGPEDPFSPPPPANLPFLGIDGSSDDDVQLADPTWLPEYVAQRRSAPAMDVLLPGFGHNYVNRALSSRKIDDRTDVGPRDPDAAAHEKMLSTVLGQWLDQTVRGAKGPMPLRPTDTLPPTVAGYHARWVALTSGSAARWAAGPTSAPMTRVGRGGAARLCRTYMPMDPTPYRDRCPEVDSGTSQMRSFVSRVRLTPHGGARVALRQANPSEMVLHLAPAGDRKDKKHETPLRITVTLSHGQQVIVPVPRGEEALRDLRTPEVNGMYTVATMRLPLPAAVRKDTVTQVTLTGGTGDGLVDVRGIDLLPSS